MNYEKWLKSGAGRDFIKSITTLSIGFISAAADGSSSLLLGTIAQSLFINVLGVFVYTPFPIKNP